MRDPVFYDFRSDAWYFWDETWADYIGPFTSEQEARAGLAHYVINEIGENGHGLG